ncbi:MAG TPA: glycosyltransferase family 39 protein, partial [Candidatus Krumholzibacteria bacterium]
AGSTNDPRGLEPAGAPLEDHMRRAAAPQLRIRVVASVISALIVPATWLLARCFLGSGAALLAAGLMAVSLLDLIFSQQARAHAPAAAFTTLAVCACVHLRRKPTLSAHAAAAVASGLAIATLQSGALVLGSLAAANLLRERASRSARLLGPVLCAAVVAAFHFAFLAESSGAALEEHLASTGGGYFRFFGHRVYYDLFVGTGFATLMASFWSMENVTSVFAVVGLSFWLLSKRSSELRRRTRPDLGVVLAYVLPYFVIFGMYHKTGARLAIALLPFLACMAAFGASRVRALLPLVRSSRVAGVAMGMLILAVPSAAAWRLASRRAEPDTATLAARWIAANVDPSARIALVPPLELPLLRCSEALQVDAPLGWGSPWRKYQAALEPEALTRQGFDLRTWPLSLRGEMDRAASDPAGYFKARATQYVVAAISHTDLVKLHTEKLLGAMEALDWRVRSVPALEQESLPRLDWGFDPRDGVNWTWRLLGDFRASGETIVIYEVGD